MSWLDRFFTTGVKTILSAGVALPQQPNLNFTGTGVTVTDDPTSNETTVEITAGSGSAPTGTGYPHVTAGSYDAAAVPLTLTGDVTASGTGTSVATVVAKVNGATVPAGGSLTTGNALKVSGAGALTYGAINLAGGSNHVSGTLPLGNGGTGLTAVPGSDKQILFNSAGAYGAISGFTKEASSLRVTTGTLPIEIGASGYATIGDIRWANGSFIAARNFGGSADARLLDFTTSDILIVGDGTNVANAYLRAATTALLMVGSTPIVTASSTFVTLDAPPKIKDSTGGQYYIWAVSNLSADRTVTMPLLTGDDEFVFAAHAQALTNKTVDVSANTFTNIANANVGAAAAIDGTKISPAFGAQSITTTGNISLGGASPATAGAVRLANNTAVSFRNQPDNANLDAVKVDTSDNIKIGSQSSSAGPLILDTNTGNGIYIQDNVNYRLYMSTSTIEAAQPIIGFSTGSSPYGCHGTVSHTFASDADYTVTPAQYRYDWLSFVTGSWTAQHAVILPHPASEARNYYKTIHNATAYTMTISTGTGATKTLASGLAERFLFSTAGVTHGSATWTP